MLSLPLLLLIIAAAAFGAFWQNSLSARERANRAAQDACTRMNLQFLDGTVAFARISLARDAGRLALRRTYVFDYSAASIERRQGFVMLLGKRIESIGFAPDLDTLRQQEPLLPSRPVNAPRPDLGEHPDHKVLNLEEWRQRRQGHAKDSAKAAEPPAGSPGNNSNDQGW